MKTSITLALTIFMVLTDKMQIYAHEGNHDGSGGGGGGGGGHGPGDGTGGGAHGSGANGGGDDHENDASGIPSPFDKAATARWLAHNTVWCSLSTINSREREGSPFGNIASFSDGARDKSTGSLYMLHSSLDASIIDVVANSLVSFSVSEMQTGYCQGKEYDAEDPRCARLSIGGRLVLVPDDEIEDAKVALFDKHPGMESWYSNNGNSGHDFRFWKVDIEEIWLVDFFGGAANIKLEAWNRGTDEEGGSLLPTSMTWKHDIEESATTSFSVVAITASIALALGFLAGRKTGGTRLASVAFEKIELTAKEDKNVEVA